MVWTATYIVQAGDAQGLVSFEISDTELDQSYTSTSDDSTMIVDMTAPTPQISYDPNTPVVSGGQVTATISFNETGVVTNNS